MLAAQRARPPDDEPESADDEASDEASEDDDSEEELCATTVLDLTEASQTFRLELSKARGARAAQASRSVSRL